MKKILLLSDLSREPDRQTIRGITKFLEKGEGWTPYHLAPFIREDSSHIQDIINRAKMLKVDAIFGAWPVVENGGKVNLDIPIVLKPSKVRVKGFSEFCSDSEKIGKIAADFFNGLEYKHLSTSGMPGRIWSLERERNFQKFVNGQFHRGIRFSNAQQEFGRISLWLNKLPKPVGIFCCNDVNASMLAEICISNGIRVPEDVAILGVDDDEFLCNITSPSISSVKLDYEKAGYQLAAKLSESIKSGDNGLFTLTHDPVCIVERNSTPARMSKDPYVKAIIKYMNDHFQEGIGLKEAIEQIPLSRRSIEVRFRKEFGSVTMLEYLIRLKIERMKELLATTDLTLLDIAFRSGFSEGVNIYRLFKKMVGCTPAEYRRIHGSN